MSRHRRARRAGAVLALAVLVPAAGCGGLPRSGPVVSGSPVVDDPRVGLLQVIPDGPVAGQSPEDVVRGFLLASAAGADDHAVARRFLTRAAAADWRPGAATTLVEAAPQVVAAGPAPAGASANAADPAPGEAPGEATVAVTAAVLADVDERGQWVQRPPGERLERTVALRREDGAWRVATPGDGVVLTRLDASRSLRPFPVHFATPDGRHLVADVRWFDYDATTATRVVTELLRGPVPWLAPAVRSGAPTGTTLQVGTVPVADGTATVDLGSAVRGASPAERTLLVAQLRAGLTRLPAVQDVRVTVDGAELVRDERGRGTVPVTPAAADARPVAAGPAGPVRLTATGTAPAAGADPALAGTTSPAVSAAGDVLAALGEGATVLHVQRAGAPAVRALVSPVPLVAPSVDRHGWVWTAPAVRDGVPLVVPADTAPGEAPAAVAAPADGLGGVPLRVRVSHDGARVLVVVRDATGATRAHVHGVVRDAAGRPLRLTAPSPELAPGAGRVLDASWLGEDDAVLLVQPAAGPPVPLVSPLSGPVERLPPLPGAVAVAGGWAERALVLGRDDGALLTRSGAGWAVVGQGRDPAAPG